MGQTGHGPNRAWAKQVMGHGALVICWLLLVICWLLLVSSHWLWVIGYWLLVLPSCRPALIIYQSFVTDYYWKIFKDNK
jgi:hypothetical protein